MERPQKPNLIYTVAFDPPESEGCRILAKMLASSLLRTAFNGDVIVFRNSETPLFLVERKGLEECYIETPKIHGIEGAEFSWCWKYRLREHVMEWMEMNGGVDAWDKVMFLDADSLALRNVDHLLEGDWDIAYHPERGHPLNRVQFNTYLTDAECAKWDRDGVNSGTLAVAASKYDAMMRHWQRIDEGPIAEGRERICIDQGSWNRVLIESEEEGLTTRAFDKGEVQFPLYTESAFGSYSKAALVHTVGGKDTIEKIRFTFGLHMSTFMCDPSALFFNFIEM